MAGATREPTALWSGANFAQWIGVPRGVLPLPGVFRLPNRLAMDASLYFRLTDRIDGATSMEELASIEAEIERTQPHMIERRALERRLNRRQSALSGVTI